MDSCETQLFSQQVQPTNMMSNNGTTMIFDSIANNLKAIKKDGFDVLSLVLTYNNSDRSNQTYKERAPGLMIESP